MAASVSGQAAGAVLMVRPSGFGFNDETATTNAFQQRPDPASAVLVAGRALREFDIFAEALRQAGVDVIVFEDPPEPHTPDAVFPNNWVSFHSDGTVVLYPMAASNRRMERRRVLVDQLEVDFGFEVSRVLDLTHYERDQRYLEGTGSIVFDHLNRRGFAGLSSRTDSAVAAQLLSVLGYEAVFFEAFDAAGRPVYHTNVVMSIGSGFAVIAENAIPDRDQRLAVVDALAHSGRDIIRIDPRQMAHFAANILELRTSDGKTVVAMSETARDAFGSGQLASLEESARIVSSDLSTIETVGGGSARCMLAEVFLPRAATSR